jgi:hypothetical protein
MVFEEKAGGFLSGVIVIMQSMVYAAKPSRRLFTWSWTA